jgi:PAS domain S-box-containing protein
MQQKSSNKSCDQLIEAIIFSEKMFLKIYGILDETKIFETLEKEFAKSKLFNLCIFQLTDDGTKLRIMAFSAFHNRKKVFAKVFGSKLKQFSVDLNETKICYQVVNEEKTLVVDFFGMLREIAPSIQEKQRTNLFGEQKTKVVMTPLYRYNKVVGIFGICSVTHPEQYVPIVKILAQRVSEALELANEQLEREKLKETIKRSEEKYKGLFEQAMDAIFISDAETGILVDCNQEATKLVGRKKSEIIGQHQRILHPPQEINGGFSRTYVQYLKEKEGQVLETKVITKKGENKDVEIKANLLDIEGKKVLQGIFRDITDRRKIRDTLTKERDLLQALMDNIPDTIYFKDTDSRFTRINRAQAQMLGVKSPDEAVGKTDFDYFTPQYAKDAYNNEQTIVKTGKPIVYKVERIRRADGQFIWVSATKVPIKNPHGIIIGIVGISRDVTELIEMQKKLESHTERLEELVKERTAELANTGRLAAIGETATMVGHDLRNPLQTIIGTLYLMKESFNAVPLTLKKRQILERQLNRISEETKYMNKIISDLRDYAGPTRVGIEETDIYDVINGTLSSLMVPNEIKITVVISESLPKLLIDPTLMRRVLTNLVINAVQAMPNGGELEIEAYEAKEGAIINVHDTGVGIPEANMPKLFQPLFTTKARGQGFGLAVCKKLSEIQGAEISVRSEVGKGTTFTVKVPLRR